MNSAAIQDNSSWNFRPDLTKHARKRMGARRLSPEAVQAALEHGRIIRVRGAEIYAVGRKEVEKLSREGIDLSQFEGVQVVCSPDGAILTVYRNRDLSRIRVAA